MYSDTIIKFKNKHNKIAILSKLCYKVHGMYYVTLSDTTKIML